MVRLVSRRGAAAIVLGLVLAGPAVIDRAAAQSTMPGGSAMPLPPSANDPPPKSNAAAAKKPARAGKAATTGEKPATARKKTGVSEPYGGGNSSYTDRIDTRPARGELQLEDDPRVKPTMEGGRPGLGMRF